MSGVKDYVALALSDPLKSLLVTMNRSKCYVLDNFKCRKDMGKTG